MTNKKLVCSPDTMIFISVLALFAVIVLGGVYLLSNISEMLEAHDHRLVKLLNNLNITELGER